MIFCVVVSMKVANGGLSSGLLIMNIFVGAESRRAADLDGVHHRVGRSIDDLDRVDVADIDEVGAWDDVQSVGARLGIARACAGWPRVAAGEAAGDHLQKGVGLDVDDVDRLVVPIGEVVAPLGAVDGTDVEGEVGCWRDIRYRDERYYSDAARVVTRTSTATIASERQCCDQEHTKNM